MNGKAIQKQYDKLTGIERTALLLAARARRDEIEIRALLDSAPSERYRLKKHFGVMDMLFHLSLIVTAQQLDNACLLLTVSHFDTEDTWRSAVLAAYVFCVNVDSWKIFCKGLGVDDAALRANLPGSMMLEYAEKIARAICPTQAEVEAALQAEYGKDARAKRAEDEAAALRAGFDQMVKCWA